jgi:protein SCO1/2
VGGSRTRLLAPVLAAALLLTGCASGTSEGAEHGGLHGTTLKNPFEAPTTPLTDTRGAPYSLAEQTDKPVTLLFFGYTNCPDVCQMVMANIASALARLDKGQRAAVDVVFVTTDPARDDEKVLRQYLARFGDGLIGLTGDLDTIVDLAASYGVFMEHEKKLASGGYDVSHSTNIFAIDAHDETAVTWRAETSPADLAADITSLLEAHS